MNDEMKKAWERRIVSLRDTAAKMRYLTEVERAELAADDYMKRLEKVVEAANKWMNCDEDGGTDEGMEVLDRLFEEFRDELREVGK